MPKLSDFKPGDPVFTHDGKRATVACVHEDCLYIKNDDSPLTGTICRSHGGQWICFTNEDGTVNDGKNTLDSYGKKGPLRRAPFLDKPAKEQGIDVTRKFVVLKEHAFFDVGDILVLKRDDTSRNPWFELAEGGGNRKTTGNAPAWWSKLTYADEPEEEKRPDPAMETKIAVHVPTRGQYDALMTAYERKGWYALGKTCWDPYKGETCVRTTSPSKSNYASRSWYEKEGYSIITFDEAMRRLREPVEDKYIANINPELLRLECLTDRLQPGQIIEIKTKPIIMENIVQKIKDLALSKDDRILRADGFEDQCGKPTSLAKDMMLVEILEERWAERRADVAKSLSEIAKEAKK